MARATAYVKVNGTDKGYSEITNGTTFKDRDLYVTVYDRKGKNLAHGENAKLVEEELVIGCRLDRRCNRAVARAASARLVDKVSGVATAQEDILEALAAIRRRLPAARRLERGPAQGR